MWNVSDDALLDGLAAGDPDASAAFVERFERRVYGLALRITGDAGLAEDVAQEAFVRAWRNASVFDPRRGTVAAWLLTIARNLAIDTMRVRRAVVLEPDDLLRLGGVAPDRAPEAAAVLSTEAARLRAALLALPTEQRRALVLAAYAGMTAREVGEHESIPLGTAKTRIRSAMLRLRVALVGEDATD
jgi:RNA polymerase sigma-70 factor (ECF subfamily)